MCDVASTQAHTMLRPVCGSVTDTMAPATPNSDRSITKTTLQSEKQSPQKNNTIAGQITEAKKKILKLKETRTYTHTMLTYIMFLR